MVVFLLIIRREAVPLLAAGAAEGRVEIIPSLAGIRLAGSPSSLRGLRHRGSLLGPTRTTIRTFLMMRAGALRTRSRVGLGDCCPA